MTYKITLKNQCVKYVGDSQGNGEAITIYNCFYILNSKSIIEICLWL